MDSESVYTIYGLKDPRTDIVRYIGVTVNHPTVRLREHLKNAHLLKTPKDHWLVALKRLGMKPSVVILAFAADAVEAKAIEKLWIQSEFASAWELTNSDHLTSSYDTRIFQTGIFRGDGRTTPHWADWLHGLLSQLVFAFAPLQRKASCKHENSGLYPGCRCCLTVTSQPANALNIQRAVVGADDWTTAPRRSQAVGEAREQQYVDILQQYTDEMERIDQRNVRDNVRESVQMAPRMSASSRRAPKPVEPTLTEKQEKVFAYFEDNAQYDRVKLAWVFPTVATMVEELGVSAGYITGLKFEWLEDKVFEEDM